jgi:hypothetical protein
MFSIDIRKLLKHQISWKSVAWNPSCSMRADRQSGMTKLIVALRNFAMRLKIPAVHLKTTKSIDCIWIGTVQHEVPVLKLTAFS